MNTTFEKKEIALKLFTAKNYVEASKIFDEICDIYASGYCDFLMGNVQNAERKWHSVNDTTSAILWGLNAIKLIQLTVPRFITFFQIRNFLERDLNLLIENNQNQAVENIISAADILAEFNPEVYKFIGRVLLYHNYFVLAYDFFQKAKDICYNDPEVHFLIAKYYIMQNKKEDAKKSLLKILDISPNYFPAKKLINSM